MRNLRFGRGEVREDTQRSNTSTYSDTENGVVVELSFHGYGSGGEGWFSVAMTPIEHAHKPGIPIHTTRSLKFTFAELEEKIQEAQAGNSRNVIFDAAYPGKRKRPQKGKMPVREIMHRINNARHTAALWKEMEKPLTKNYK